ncbi:MAG: hypothetical protein U1F87_05860 [Kiritimatiellia bacterium]
MTCENRFEKIYARNIWGNGPGEGSHPRHTAGHVAFLQSFLAANRVRSVVDFGCGDWQFSRLVDHPASAGTGFDIVRPVVRRTLPSRPDNVGFRFDPGRGIESPPADLLIVKDAAALVGRGGARLCRRSQRFPLALITNCMNSARPNVNPADHRRRIPLPDLRAAPFHLPAEEVFSLRSVNLLVAAAAGRFWRKSVLCSSGRPA